LGGLPPRGRGGGAAGAGAGGGDVAALIEAVALAKHYPGRRTLDQALRGQRPMVRAVDGVDLRLERGESVGLVGESGSGKTTIGRMLLKLAPPSDGAILFGGEDLATMDRRRTRRFRGQAQLVFQNPFDALNPRFAIGRALGEPLRNTGVAPGEHAARIAEALRRVGLPEAVLARLPHQLSGGQLQRVGLARALVLRPEFLVADEPVSMLDVSVRAGILLVLQELRASLGLTMLAISHDLTLVRAVCERTLVLYLGRVVEDGPTASLIARPAHPYTQALIRAVPRPRVAQDRSALPLGVANAVSPAGGCRLRDRCPHAFARCSAEVPLLLPVGVGHRAACHLYA